MYGSLVLGWGHHLSQLLRGSGENQYIFCWYFWGVGGSEIPILFLSFMKHFYVFSWETLWGKQRKSISGGFLFHWKIDQKILYNRGHLAKTELWKWQQKELNIRGQRKVPPTPILPFCKQWKKPAVFCEGTLLPTDLIPKQKPGVKNKHCTNGQCRAQFRPLKGFPAAMRLCLVSKF